MAVVADGPLEAVRVTGELVRRDIVGRFVGARFGLVWSVLNPAIQLASYSFVFGYIYRPPGDSEAGFVASLFCGLWPWWAFNEGVTNGLSALASHASLLKKMPIPPNYCVVAAVSAAFLLNLLGFALFLLVFWAIGLTPFRMSWLFLPGAIALAWTLTVSLALFLAPIYLVVRDTGYVVSAVLTIGFFASPVLYSTAALPPNLASVSALNPMSGLIGLYRSAVLGHDLPGTFALVGLLLFLCGTAALAAFTFARVRPVLDEYL